MDEIRIKLEFEKAVQEHKVLVENIRKSSYELDNLKSKKNHAEMYVREAQVKLDREQAHLDGIIKEQDMLERKIKDFNSRVSDHERKVDDFKNQLVRIQQDLKKKY